MPLRVHGLLIAGALATALVAASLNAQSANSSLAFEVASIKSSPPDATGMSISGPRPASFLARNAPLERLIMYAFGMREEQLVELPGWARTERYDIEAKYPGGQLNPKDVALMVQNLLVERFKLQTHPDKREGPTYSLVLARRDGRLGPKLKSIDIDCAKYFAEQQASGKPVQWNGVGDLPTCMAVASDRFIKFSVRSIANLTQALSGRVGRPVTDHTGLTGNYDINLEWTPGLVAEPAPTNGVVTVATPGDSVSLFTALQEQLGLKLESARGPVDVLVIDHVERPTGN